MALLGNPQSLRMNFASWHMKHSAMVAAKSEIDMEEAKKVKTIYYKYGL